MTVAHEIVDTLVEGLFSDEDMQGFADAASYIFHWKHTPSNSPEAASFEGEYNFSFKMLKYRCHGYMPIHIHRDVFGENVGRCTVRFSVNLTKQMSSGGEYGVNSRMKDAVIRFTGLEEFKKAFEDWVKGPLSSMLERGKYSSPALTSAIRILTVGMKYVPVGGFADVPAVEALEARFDLGASRGVYRYDGITDDPRAQGRETDYKYMSNDDVRFWNMMADEYDAKAH